MGKSKYADTFGLRRLRYTFGMISDPDSAACFALNLGGELALGKAAARRRTPYGAGGGLLRGFQRELGVAAED
ncbi:MAG: hypothetical protein WCC18_06480 [Candidatus Acidiferrales bacterium]